MLRFKVKRQQKKKNPQLSTTLLKSLPKYSSKTSYHWLGQLNDSDNFNSTCCCFLLLFCASLSFPRSWLCLQQTPRPTGGAATAAAATNGCVASSVTTRAADVSSCFDKLCDEETRPEVWKKKWFKKIRNKTRFVIKTTIIFRPPSVRGYWLRGRSPWLATHQPSKASPRHRKAISEIRPSPSL